MTPTLFSVSYAGLWGQARLELPGFLRKAAELGYPAVELMCKRPHLSILNGEEETMHRLRRQADEAGVEIATLAGYTDFTAGRHAVEVPFVEMQVAYVDRLARMGKILGAKIIRVFTGYVTEEEDHSSGWRQCVTAIRECAAIAEEQGLVLGVQNHHDVGVAWEACIEFLEEVNHPSCRAMFDPWSPALQGDDLYACAKTLAPYMVQTTLADYVKLRRWKYMPGLINYRELPAVARAVPVGDGFVDSAAFCAGLKDGGFDGYVAYEMCSPLRGGGAIENLDAAARKSLERIQAYTAS